jgi:signal transduction histidine kinase
VVVYRRHPENPIHKLYLGFTLSVLFWLTFNLLADTSVHEALLWSRLTYVGSSLIAIFLVYFGMLFPRQEKPVSKAVHILVLGLGSAMIFITLATNLIVAGIKIESWGTDIVPGVLNGIYPLYFLFFAGWAQISLWRRFRRSVGVERSQLLYISLGLLLTLIFGIYTNSLSYFIIGDYRLAKYGPDATIFLVVFSAYAIVAHRLFDIRVIIKRTVIFTGLSAFTLSMYAAVVFVLSGLFGSQGGNTFALGNIIPNFVAAIVIAISLDPLRHWLTESTDNWLFKGEYKQEDVLKNLALTLANVIDIDEAIRGMIQVVVDQMRLHKAVVFMLHPNTKMHEHELRGVAKVGEFSESVLGLAPKDELVEYFEEMGTELAELVVIEELKRMGQTNSGNKFRAGFIKRAELLDASVVMPLIISRQESVLTAPGTPTQTKEVKNLIGILALGAKKSGDTFSDQDLKMLQIVANETAAAIEKGRFFEEDRLKTEFVSIASHELLTPTTSMKGYLSMILDEGIGKVDPTARGYLEKVYSETNRLAVLVKDLLNVSRIDRGKIVVEPKVQDVLPLVQHAVETQELKAKEQKLALKLESPKKALPLVNVDSDKLLEVFINVIGNGLKYTKKGSVTVSLSSTSTQVIVSIKDTGIGIGPSDVQHLFGKFFRASNSDETGQTGTGLGLYVSKYMTELMGGTIAVDSVIGKGTTFSIILPVAKKG